MTFFDFRRGYTHRNGRTDEQGEDESDDVMTGSPKVNVDGVENDEDREAP